MDTVERSVLQEPVNGAGTGRFHDEKDLADVEGAVRPGMHHVGT